MPEQAGCGTCEIRSGTIFGDPPSHTKKIFSLYCVHLIRKINYNNDNVINNLLYPCEIHKTLLKIRRNAATKWYMSCFGDLYLLDLTAIRISNT